MTYKRRAGPSAGRANVFIVTGGFHSLWGEGEPGEMLQRGGRKRVAEKRGVSRSTHLCRGKGGENKRKWDDGHWTRSDYNACVERIIVVFWTSITTSQFGTGHRLKPWRWIRRRPRLCQQERRQSGRVSSLPTARQRTSGLDGAPSNPSPYKPLLLNPTAFTNCYARPSSTNCSGTLALKMPKSMKFIPSTWNHSKL